MDVMSVVRDLGAGLPLILVYLLGLVVALLQMSRWPRAAMSVAVGLGLMLLTQIVRPIVFQAVLQMVVKEGPGPQLSMALGLTGLLFNLLEAAAIGALVYAAFADRPLVAEFARNHPQPTRPAG